MDTSRIASDLNYRKPYQFRKGTEKFFAPNVPIWARVLDEYREKPNVWFLNVGVFEGQSCLWMLENILTHPTSFLIGVDPFTEVDPSPSQTPYKDVFFSNLRLSGLGNKTHIIEGLSQTELRRLDLESFDIIYIDGSHDAADCLEDAVLAWRLLKDEGVLIFDDYLLSTGPFDVGDKPKIAIDAFLGLFGHHFEIIHCDWQAILRKKPGSATVSGVSVSRE